MEASLEDLELSNIVQEKDDGKTSQIHDAQDMLGSLPHLDEISEGAKAEIEGSAQLVEYEENMPTMDELILEDFRIQEEKKHELIENMQQVVEVEEVEEIIPNKVDTGLVFFTQQLFKTEADAVDWLITMGRSVGVVLVRARSDYSEGRNPYVKFTCERGGPMRSHHKGKGYVKKISGEGKHKPRLSTTRKCGCTFLLLLRQDKKVDGWRVTVKNGYHNHSLNRSNLGHSFMGRLRDNERDLLCRLTKSGTMPKVIQKELKDLNPNNCTPAQTIYNERVKLKKTLRDNRTVMQEVFYQARESDVFLRYTCSDYDVIENLFWAHRNSLLLAKNFPHVFMMDCTYKTNFYKLPLLHIVGVSSTNLTFSVAFAYLGSEKIQNYEWALRQLRDALVNNIGPTKVIVTDRELALMDAIQTVFPEASNLLCRWHIEKAVRAKVRQGISEDECDNIASAWNKIVYSETEEQFIEAIDECKEKVSGDVFAYMDTTWVALYKERFVSLWTNKVFHLGNTRSSRVEGAHAALKNWLGTANCDMATGWNAVASLCEQQFRNIKGSFETSTIKWSVQTFGEQWCRYLRGVVSLHGLTLIKKEFDKSRDVGVDRNKCGCVLRQTHGLPCAHEIATIMQQRDSLPRTCVHEHWKTLSMDGPLNDEVVDPTPLIEAYLQAFNVSTTTQQLEMAQRLREVIEPASTMLSQPTVKINPKGRPKKRRSNKVDERSTKREPSLFEHVDMAASYEETHKIKHEAKERKSGKSIKKAKVHKEDVDVVKLKNTTGVCLEEACVTESVKMACKPCPLMKLPIRNMLLDLNLPYVHPKFRDFVDDIINVDADGNCGYRSVAVALGRHENEWPIIREDLFDELRGDLGHYDKMFFMPGYTATLITKVEWYSGGCGQKYWMETPTMIWPIAERYNVVVSLFSSCLIGGNVTCFPTKRPPMTDAPLHIAILFRNKHYFCLKMKDNCPLPFLFGQWKEEAPNVSKENSEAWLRKFGSRLEEGERLLSDDHRAYINTIHV